MGKFWSIFFGGNLLACAAFSFAAPYMGLWLPEGVSTHAGSVDSLFYVILWVTTFFFFLTEAILVIFMWNYGSREGKPAVASKAEFPGFLKPLTGLLDSQHKIELAWTVVPAGILLYIAFAQITAWADIKYKARMGNITKGETPVQLAVSGRQFEWRVRYPAPKRFEEWMNKNKAANKKELEADYKSFGEKEQFDDVRVVNELHIWKDHPVLVHLTTRDVIHSFNLPNFRVKQDALPGKMIPVWFVPTKANSYQVQEGVWEDGHDPQTYKEGETKNKKLIYDIPCAELCGWGHYRMIGRVYVHKDQGDFLAWLKKAADNNNTDK